MTSFDIVNVHAFKLKEKQLSTYEFFRSMLRSRVTDSFKMKFFRCQTGETRPKDICGACVCVCSLYLTFM